MLLHVSSMNSDEIIYVLNNLTYALSLVTILSGFVRNNIYLNILYFCTVFLMGLLMNQYVNLLMIPLIVVTFIFCVYKKRKIIQAFFQSISTLFLVSIPIIFVTSIAILILPKHYLFTFGYNLSVGAAQLSICILLRVFTPLRHILNAFMSTEKSLLLTSITEMLIIFICSFLLPGLPIENIRTFSVVNLVFLCILVVLFFAICEVKKEELKLKEANTKLLENELYKSTTQKQYEAIISIGHYYANLHNSIYPYIANDDFEGLKIYFEKYVHKFHIDHFLYDTNISHIHNDLIKNLLITGLSEIQSWKRVEIVLNIPIPFVLQEDIEMDLFKIISVFLGNAIDELRNQPCGLFIIEIININETIIISVSNSIKSSQILDKIKDRQKRKANGRGHGLDIVDKIVMQSICFEHFTIKEAHVSGRKMLTQKIIYHGKEMDYV